MKPAEARKGLSPEQEETLWVTLAELFFLDTETDPMGITNARRLLEVAGWDEAQTRRVLVQLIAPVAGANLGYLIWPVIGAWAGFDRASLCAKIRRRAALRALYPEWAFAAQDWYSLRMLRALGAERLVPL